MKTNDKEQKTVRYYDDHAKDWAVAHGDSDATFWKKEMKVFNDFLPKGSVLEIGSGTGRDAKALIELGYEYTGTDISRGLLELASVRNPKATFLKQSVYELDLEQQFDGFWCVATLLHIPKDRIDEALQSIKSQVRKGAIGFISLKLGEGEKIDESTGRFFSYYSLSEFRKILLKNGFSVLKTGVKSKGIKTWIMYWVQLSL